MSKNNTLAHYGMDGLLDAIDNINDAKVKQSPTVPTDAVVLDADMRNGCGAVEHRTALRPSTMAHSPRGGGAGLVLPSTFVFCVIPLSPRYFQAFPTSYSAHSPCVRVNARALFCFPPIFDKRS